MIRGKNVVLRHFVAADLEEYALLRSDVEKKGPFVGLGMKTEVSLRKDFEENGLWAEDASELAIIDPEGRFLGVACFFRDHHSLPGYEIGCILYHAEGRNRGYGTEAMRLLSAYLFAARPIARLQAVTCADNQAAIRMIQKCGFQEEGRFEHYMFLHGEYRTALQFRLLRDECPSLKELLDAED